MLIYHIIPDSVMEYTDYARHLRVEGFMSSGKSFTITWMKEQWKDGMTKVVK